MSEIGNAAFNRLHRLQVIRTMPRAKLEERILTGRARHASLSDKASLCHSLLSDAKSAQPHHS
jgi:hypothetical protein